jgi:hypothetical protein
MVDREIIYRVHPNGGAVFALKSEAVYVDQIYRALSGAVTWGQFREMLPKGEWETIVDMVQNTHGWPEDFEGVEDDDDGFDDGMVRWDRDDAPFSGYDHIPQAADGDYPIFLQQTMDGFIPEEVLTSFGTLTDSVLNGPYWHISPDRIEDVVEWLRRDGYTVTPDSTLKYF